MPSLKPINKKEHLNSGWKVLTEFSTFSNESVVEISIVELAHVISYLPIAFVCIDKDNFKLVALQSLHHNENLFIDQDGRYNSPYIPFRYRSYPFSLANISHEDKTQQVFCIDMDSDLYRENPILENKETKFFNEEGDLLPALDHMSKLILNQLNQLKITKQAVETLVDAKILSHIELNIEIKDPSHEILKGIYRVDEKKLNSLEPQVLKELQSTNALPIIYAQLFSMKNIDTLKKLYIQKQQYQEKQSSQQPNIEDMDIDNMFADDIIKF